MPNIVTAIRSSHLKILRFPIGGAYQYRDNFAQFKTMQRRQQVLLVSTKKKKKKGGGCNQAFFRDN